MTIDHPAASQENALRELWKEAFHDTDAYLDLFFREAYSSRRSLCAVEGETPVSAVYWLDCSCRGAKLAYIYALATKKTHQGRGIARALMERVHSLLKEQGYAGVLLVPGTQKLFDYYAALGYQRCTRIQEFVCAGAADEVQLRRITAEDFARQRRDLLSLLEPRGVIQEGENLALLAGQANFYAGQNFLLAARREGDALVGLELLGDAQMAPGILQTLGCVSGSFRTRGNGQDFAMYLPLDGGAVPPPTYFGLAFD